MATRVSFGRDDVAMIDWSAALLVDREPDDVRSVLEFANLQLLEVRFLDAALDRALDRSYEVVSSAAPLQRVRPLRVVAPRSRRDRQLRGRRRDPVRARRQRDQAGRRSVPRARLPRRVAALPPGRVERGILRKLETIESLYRKVSDRASGARAEALEWIIIALIALEILFSFVPGLRPG